MGMDEKQVSLLPPLYEHWGVYSEASLEPKTFRSQVRCYAAWAITTLEVYEPQRTKFFENHKLELSLHRLIVDDQCILLDLTSL